MPATRHATVTLQDGLAFQAIVGSGHAVTMDASAAHGGQDRGASPMELLLASLGGCTAIDVASILSKMRQEVTAYRVEVVGTRRDEHPQVFTDIRVEHILCGPNLDPDRVARAVELSATRYCSASAMLSAVARVEHTYRIEPEPAPGSPASQRPEPAAHRAPEPPA